MFLKRFKAVTWSAFILYFVLQLNILFCCIQIKLERIMSPALSLSLVTVTSPVYFAKTHSLLS